MTKSKKNKQLAATQTIPAAVFVASAPDGVFTSAAGHALTAIRVAAGHVPGGTFLEPKAARTLAARYCTDPRFLEAVCTAVEASPELARLTKLDTVKIRNAIRMDAAYAPVEQEGQSLVDSIHGARVTCYCDAVDEADDALKAARGLMATSAKKELGDHVARMTAARAQKRKTSDRPRPSKRREQTSSGTTSSAASARSKSTLAGATASTSTPSATNPATDVAANGASPKTTTVTTLTS